MMYSRNLSGRYLGDTGIECGCKIHVPEQYSGSRFSHIRDYDSDEEKEPVSKSQPEKTSLTDEAPPEKSGINSRISDSENQKESDLTECSVYPAEKNLIPEDRQSDKNTAPAGIFSHKNNGSESSLLNIFSTEDLMLMGLILILLREGKNNEDIVIILALLLAFH